jgi:CRP-like cAMP-binding protein
VSAERLPLSYMTARFALRVQSHVTLRHEEKLELESAAAPPRRYLTGERLMKAGAPVEYIFLILDGFACRSRLLPDGRRQIVALMLPGDLCDPRTFVLPRMDHTICALSPVEAIQFSAGAIRHLERFPGLSSAIEWNAVVQQSIAREWLVNVGHRTAFERVGHLLCEIFERLEVVGLTHDNSCSMPLSQSELADILALSTVHVNRTLMDLRRSGLVTLRSHQLTLHDPPALRAAVGFESDYLTLQPPSVPGRGVGNLERVAVLPTVGGSINGR